MPSSKQDIQEDASAESPPRLSPGTRLAQQRDAKAARKTSKRGRQAERVESKAIARVEQTRDWLSAHRTRILLIALSVVVAASVGIALGYRKSAANAVVASKLREGVTRARASLNQAPGSGNNPSTAPKTVKLDARRADLRKAQSTLRALANTEHAWAQLLKAVGLTELGETASALRLYNQIVEQSKDRTMLRWRALMGRAAAHEALGRNDKAIADYREVASLEQGAYRNEAEFHIALLHRERDPEQTKKSLLAIKKRLDAKGRSSSQHLAGRVQQQLRSLGSAQPQNASSSP